MDELSRYFDILEIRRGASPEEIKRAYRDMAQVWHPDRYSHNPRLRAKAEEKLKNINEAYQRLSAHSQRGSPFTPPSPKTSPPPPQSQRTEAREAKPEPPPTSTTASKPAPAAQPSKSNAGCIVSIVIFVGFLIIIGASQHSSDTQSYHVQPSYQPPQSQPPPPPAPDPELVRLTEMKTQIEERIAQKDAEFDRLGKWYQRGVSAQDEAAYRESLVKAQQEEQDIEALILTYNAQKKELDDKINPK